MKPSQLVNCVKPHLIICNKSPRVVQLLSLPRVTSRLPTQLLGANKRSSQLLSKSRLEFLLSHIPLSILTWFSSLTYLKIFVTTASHLKLSYVSLDRFPFGLILSKLKAIIQKLTQRFSKETASYIRLFKRFGINRLFGQRHGH